MGHVPFAKKYVSQICELSPHDVGLARPENAHDVIWRDVDEKQQERRL